ncbi:MAG: 6,7-dimethyl-8-ribityllumazine synthase [Phycisphaerales bacterium]|nr:6,7-dimethyl-8-ribityllumazine synthase [Phycisphaerales bacterium]
MSTTNPVPPAVIVASRYNATITDALVEGARTAYLARGGDAARLVVMPAAGAFEVPGLCAAAAREGFAVVVAIGCIVKGETSHDQHLASAVTGALADLASGSGVAVGLGVLTVDTIEQARARSGGRLGNKGEEAMLAALDTFRASEALRPCVDSSDGHELEDADAYFRGVHRRLAAITPGSRDKASEGGR